jgi:hypothetical protein
VDLQREDRKVLTDPRDIVAPVPDCRMQVVILLP